MTYSSEYRYESGWVYQDGNQRPQQVQLSSTSTQEIIDNDPKSSDLSTKLLAVTTTVSTTICGSVTVEGSGNPTVNCVTTTSYVHYTIDTGEWTSGGGAGGGGGDTSWGGGGGGGPAGQGPASTSVANMPSTMTMDKQKGAGTCIPASLAQVKVALCGNGGKTVGQIYGDMWLYGLLQYGSAFTNDGVPLGNVGDFINHYFTTTILAPAGNYQGAIDAGHPIMIDVFSHMDGPPPVAVYHSVVITGYNPANPSQVYYLDPGTGTTHTGNGASLLANSHYAVPITGCH